MSALGKHNVWDRPYQADPLDVAVDRGDVMAGATMAGATMAGATMAMHSELAMRAARRMARSRHKEKNGRIICRHLLQMLAEEGDCLQSVRSTRRILIDPMDLAPAGPSEKQYLLSL